MNVIALIFEPPVFYSILIVLFVVSISVIYSFVRQSKEKEKEAGTSHTRIAELETLVTQKEGEYVRKLSSIEATMKGKEEELHKRIKVLEDQVKENDKLKKDFAKAEMQLKEKEELAKKETANKGELEKKIKDMQNELAKLNKDLSLKNQMYEGLRGQYEELEKEHEKLIQQTQDSKPYKPELRKEEKKVDLGPEAAVSSAPQIQEVSQVDASAVPQAAPSQPEHPHKKRGRPPKLHLPETPGAAEGGVVPLEEKKMPDSTVTAAQEGLSKPAAQAPAAKEQEKQKSEPPSEKPLGPPLPKEEAPPEAKPEPGEQAPSANSDKSPPEADSKPV